MQGVYLRRTVQNTEECKYAPSGIRNQNLAGRGLQLGLSGPHNVWGSTMKCVRKLTGNYRINLKNVLDNNTTQKTALTPGKDLVSNISKYIDNNDRKQ